MTDLPTPPPSRDLPPGTHTALRSRVLEGTYDEAPSHRYWLLPLAAAAAVLIIVFTAIGVLRSTTPEPAPVTSVPPSPTAAPSVSPSPTGPPPANPATFDPLWTRLTPGWLPAGLPVTDHFVGRSEESLRAGSYTGPTVTITIHPRTHPGSAPTGRSGPDVNGKPSTWSESAMPNRGVLTWEWADGAEARVQLLSFQDDAGSRTVAARIAEGLRPQSPVRTALPFTVQGPPYAWVLDTRVSRSGEGYGGGIRFGPTGGVVKEVQIGWSPVQLAPAASPPNDTANGRDVSVWYEGDVLVVWQAFDQKVAQTWCTPKPGAAAAAVRAECLVIAGGIARTGDNARPSTWSTDPVR
jgi:hypothetical protein